MRRPCVNVHFISWMTPSISLSSPNGGLDDGIPVPAEHENPYRFADAPTRALALIVIGSKGAI